MSVRIVNMHEAKTHLSRLVDEEFIIAEDGRPVAPGDSDSGDRSAAPDWVPARHRRSRRLRRHGFGRHRRRLQRTLTRTCWTPTSCGGPHENFVPGRSFSAHHCGSPKRALGQRRHRVGDGDQERLGRADFRVDPSAARDRALLAGYRELPVRGQHALPVADLPPIHACPFDRMLLAQARAEGMLLLTADNKVLQYGSGTVAV